MTFLDPEERAYPTGSLQSSRRHFRAVCPDGVERSGICGIADTFFSIPARLKAHGKTVTGYVTMGDNQLEFRPYKYRKNWAIFS